jgi:hypothetical protein
MRDISLSSSCSPRHETNCSYCYSTAVPLVEANIVRCWQVHKLCQDSAERILNDFKPNLMIAIGGGGYVPARILRSVQHGRASVGRTSNDPKIILEAPWITEHTNSSHRPLTL